MIIIKTCYFEALEMRQKICLSACSDKWDDEWDLLFIIVAIFDSWTVMLWRKKKVMKEKKKKKKKKLYEENSFNNTEWKIKIEIKWQ